MQRCRTCGNYEKRIGMIRAELAAVARKAHNSTYYRDKEIPRLKDELASARETYTNHQKHDHKGEGNDREQQ